MAILKGLAKKASALIFTEARIDTYLNKPSFSLCMVLICGIDESGRGPVIGPMVIAGVLASEPEIKLLEGMKVKDSKLLTPKRRSFLYDKIIKSVSGYKIIVLPPKEIDAALESDSLNLNLLEGVNIAAVINELNPDKAYIDCPSNNIEEFKRFVKKNLTVKAELILEHKADVRYPVVSAASILAKVTRDKEVELLKKEIGIDFGSGYATDPITQEFIKKHYNAYPEIFRKSWETYKSLKRKEGQKGLKEFSE
ncbi:MAG TPA: ribonuclease HII [Candidatus Nanoarchaeia archaeon]|nr:ribonuclease HII [Candidatus Nanoarchaeia archaeon]